MREMSRSRGGAWPFVAAAVALLAVLLSRPAHVGAQQWATAANGTDAYNTNTSTGKVGVGTQAPAYAFHVEGASTDTNRLMQAYFKNTNTAMPYGGVGVDGVHQSHLRFLLNGYLKWQWRVGAGNGIDDLRAYSWAQSADVLTLKNNGFVGVGTDSPSNQLHVANGSGAGFVRVSGAGGGAMNFEDTSAAGGSRLYQWRSVGGAFRMALVNDTNGAFIRDNILAATAAGNVGVGTDNPVSPAGFGRVVHLRGGPDAGFVADAGGQYRNEFGVSASGGWVGTTDAIPLRLAAGGAERVRVEADGDVGIGTPTPAVKLDVNAGSNMVVAINATGGINATGAITGGSIQAKFQDVAEWVPSTQKLAAGTVVILDAGRTNHVVASATAYDTKVAGVVSAEPGVILGVGGEGKLKVATTGRVKVKADATRAPIRIGDLVVTSDVEGMAMRSEPVTLGGRQMHAPGTIIGKALEPLEKGTGEILVLLSLQ